MCVTAQVRVGAHLCTCVYGSAHMRIHMRVQGCACTSACKWRHARCCLRVSVQRWPMWVCVHMCVQIWACTAMCRGMRLQCLHMGLCKGRVAQLDHKYAIGLNRTCSCTHVAVCTQECKGCACVCKGRLEMCAYRSLCLNMDVSFCTRVYMHVDVCVLMDVSKGVLAHVCTCLPVGVCRCVDTHACARTGVCANRCLHVSACFFTRVCVHRGAPALTQKSFLGEAELTQDCWRAQGWEVQLCSTARCTAACRTARSTAASGCWDAGMRHCTEHTLTHTVGQSERLSTAVHSYRSAKRSQKDHQPAQLGLAVRGGTGWLRALRASPWRQRCPLPELPHPAALLTCLYALSRITHSTRGQRVNAQCSAGGAANPQLVAGASSLLPKHSSGPVAEFLHHCSVISVHCAVCSACGSFDSCSFSPVTAYLQPRS